MNITIATVIGFAGTLLAAAYTVPQLSKLIRGHSAAGISVAALANSTISGIAWTVFGVLEGELWVALPAFVALPATAGALVLAWRGGGSAPRMWLPVVWLAVILPRASLVPLVGDRPITRRARLLGGAAHHAGRDHRLAQPRRVGHRRLRPGRC